MDVQMPVLGGFEATRAIRQLGLAGRTHVPIVAMTARAMKGDRERCLQAGMDEYLSKPIQGKRLTEVIRLVLPSPVQAAAPGVLAIDDAAALALVGGDTTLLREVKDLCIRETPRLLEEIQRALTAGLADAVAEAAHTLRGMCLVFVPNDVVRRAGDVEERAEAGDLIAAGVAYADLRSAADDLITALSAQEVDRALSGPAVRIPLL